MTVEYLSRRLAEDEAFLEETGCTWYLIKCIDPDGTRRNEGWFKGPFTLRNYAEHYFRPAMDRQAEWTFPLDYKDLHFHEPVPETQALMALIDRIHPAFMYSLHNAGFGGAFWYISRDVPEIYSRFGEVPGKYGIPLSLGEPEMPCCVRYAPAVYQMLSTEAVYDFYETYGCPDPASMVGCGASSDGYANRAGDTLTLVCELPYFYNPKVADVGTADISRKEAMLKSCETAEHCCRFLKGQIERLGDLIEEENPYRRMIVSMIRMMGGDSESKKRMIRQNPEFDRPAKICEEFDNLYGNAFNWMTFLGLLTHMTAEEQEKEKKETKRAGILREVYEAGMAEIDRLDRYLQEHVTYSVIPIRHLVAIQLECAFIALEQLDA